MRSSNIVPESFTKVVARELSRNFRASTGLIRVPFPTEIKPTEMIVRNLWAGVNASDVNYTAGVYRPNLQPPFDVGFEGLGQVVAVGAKVHNVDLHDFVLTQSFGTFSEYQVVASRYTRRVPKPDPRYLPLEVSGTTASIAIDRVLEPQRGEVALVTAAAGGTGQFAAQLLKHRYGCHVIGTCSAPHKADFLRSVGVDRVINYKQEDLDDVLSSEYRGGVNLCYESVGGRFFDLGVKHLATKGRLAVIGNITGYQTGSSFGEKGSSASGNGGDGGSTEIPPGFGTMSETGAPRSGFRPGAPIGSTLLWKSAKVQGFFLPHYQKYVPDHFDTLRGLVDDETIESALDPYRFTGVESAADAVEHLLSGKSCGKVVIEIGQPITP